MESKHYFVSMQAFNVDENDFLLRMFKSTRVVNYVLGRHSFIRMDDGTLYTFSLPDLPDVVDRWLDGAVYASDINCKGRVHRSDIPLPDPTLPNPIPTVPDRPAPRPPPTPPDPRKRQPLARGVLDYFPAALKAVAECSWVGNEQHNPGEAMHHARGKSSDHADALLRHLTERGSIDTDGVRHSAKVAWRALAMLQEELEAAGEPKARGAK